MENELCTRYKKDPMAYPYSNNHWCKACLEEVRKVHYDPTKRRDKNLQQNYQGFGSKDYDVLFQKQGGICAICGIQQRRHLHVDHDHETGTVRGLLYNDCNTALGHLHDSPEIIRKLLEYILQFQREELP